MRNKIDSAVAEVEAQYNAGNVPWNYKTVQSLIGKYPHRGHLDVIKLGQEDEATPDPDGVPWEVPGPGEPPAADDDADDGREDDDEKILDFDPDDWHKPPENPFNDSDDAPSKAGTGEATSHGHGGGGDDTAATDQLQDHGDGESLSVEQVSTLHEHSARFQSLQEAKRIFESIGGALGASLSNTVRKVMHDEQKRFRQRIDGDAAVEKAMRTTAEAEEAEARRRRAEFQQAAQRKREIANVERELQQSKAKLRQARRDLREATDVAEASEALKTFSLEAMGKGQKNAGGAAFRKVRQEALSRVRSVARLSPEQRNDWSYFATNWGKKMVEEHGEAWPAMFAEILQNVVNELEAGRGNALSDFMRKESVRVFGGVNIIRLPGVAA